LRGKLKWFERRPLLGRKVVVTRAWAQMAEMGRALTELGAEVIPFPTIRIEGVREWRRVDGEIRNLGKYDWVVFTSGNGVEGLMGRMGALGLDARAMGGVRICAIGPATAERLGEYFLRVDCMPREYVSRAIVGALKKRGGIRGKSFLLARGDIATGELPEALRALGGRVKEAVVYRTVEDVTEGMAALIYEEEFAKGGVAYVTFTSASTARSFAGRYDARRLREIAKKARVVSIGPVTSKTLRALGLAPRVEAREHTVAGVIRAILQDAKPRKRKK
jgi:uroporphyrinogen III methyltransferase/synthase